MWILNKITGVKWDINNKELIKRLSQDDNFEEVIDELEISYTKEELEGLIFNDLLKIAKKKGINSHRMKQNELISAILEMEE